ncbi:MAG: polysaccharide export protein [Endomicrobiaceae bacterium]|nr:polysaccharide export protein [Endomicrobiaceae bacterium]MDD3053139.1 polysaccharide export protein [Endomicrobiaceae bacterium]MDD3922214.1 polysaccharide export protein [Endomicrobiaceae bacterium]
MNNILFKLTVFVFITCLFFSCASTSVRNDESLVKQQNPEEIKEQVLNDISQIQCSNDYVLQPGDLLEITVFMEDGMNRTLRISGNGTITFPLIGNLKISGYSVAQAEVELVKALKQFIKNPQISMLIKEYGNKTVYVLGQVKKPSAIQIPPEKSLTILEAITSVGGFTDIANTSKVKVLRLEKGKQKSIEVDVTQITKQGNKSLDISLMPGDVIFVPQSMF